MRNNFRILMLAACHCLMTGCAHRNAPVDTGPIFSLGEIPPVETVDSIPINFQDARPKWERRYYSGSVNPRNYEWAMTFVPMQNFQPDFEKHLQAEIIELSQNFQERPAAVSVTLTSFSMSFNDVENRKVVYEHIKDEEEHRKEEQELEREEREREEERWERMHHAARHGRGKHVPHDDDEMSFGEQLISDFLGAFFRGFVDMVAETMKRDRPNAIRDGRRLLVEPPDELRNRNYAPGLTCEFRAVVSFQWNDGTNFQTDVTGWSYVGRPVGESTFSTEDVSESVRAAIRTMRYDLSRQTTTLQKPEYRNRLADESKRIGL